MQKEIKARLKKLKSTQPEQELFIRKLAESVFLRIYYMDRPEIYAKQLLDSKHFYPEDLSALLDIHDKNPQLIDEILTVIYHFIVKAE